MIKKVLIEDDGFVSHIFHDDSWRDIELQEGQVIENREYEQVEGGWYPIGQRPLSETDKIRLEMARSNAEMFEMMVSMMGGAM